jgi:cytoskeletal protein CcmA (bactofilin family)
MAPGVTLLAFAGWFVRDGGGSARGQADEAMAAPGEGPGPQASEASGRPPAGPRGSFIGAGVRLVGSLHCQEDVTVQGHVKGPMVAKGRVVVERGGLAEGDIQAAAICVRGRTRGTLVARKEVALEAGGEHRGGLHTPSLIVEAGARVDGEVKAGPSLPRDEGLPQEDVR